MSQVLVKAVSPSQINVKNDFVGSGFGKSEYETIARNIVVISNIWGGWKTFSWSEYQMACKHTVTDAEKRVLDSLVLDGYLLFSDQKYAIIDKFIAALSDFILE